MTKEPLPTKARLLPLLVLLIALGIWSVLTLLKVFPEAVFPSPLAVAKGFGRSYAADDCLTISSPRFFV